MRETATKAQIAANQNNSQKSTGPKTAAGREVSKLNALRHGILAREAVVWTLHHKESRGDLEALEQRLHDALQPVGPVEEMLVDQIVSAQWRLRRAMTAESGEIALSVNRQGELASSNLAGLCRGWHLDPHPLAKMQETAMGNHMVEEWLRELRQAVEQEGGFGEAAVQRFVKSFPGKPNLLTRQVEELRLKLQANPDGLDAAALRERQKTGALKYLDGQISSFASSKEKCMDQEVSEQIARNKAALLPAAEVVDKFIRYETKLERQMFRAMAQLERLQRMRGGEAVPAPLTVDVSHAS
jgi:hypothetical protein